MNRADLKRINPGYYRGEIAGKVITIFQVRARGIEGGRCSGWNLQINGRTVSDWLPSLKAAIASFNRNHATC